MSFLKEICSLEIKKTKTVITWHKLSEWERARERCTMKFISHAVMICVPHLNKPFANLSHVPTYFYLFCQLREYFLSTFDK